MNRYILLELALLPVLLLMALVGLLVEVAKELREYEIPVDRRVEEAQQ
jgi:hypothetical protein